MVTVVTTGTTGVFTVTNVFQLTQLQVAIIVHAQADTHVTSQVELTLTTQVLVELQVNAG